MLLKLILKEKEDEDRKKDEQKKLISAIVGGGSVWSGQQLKEALSAIASGSKGSTLLGDSLTRLTSMLGSGGQGAPGPEGGERGRYGTAPPHQVSASRFSKFNPGGVPKDDKYGTSYNTSSGQPQPIGDNRQDKPQGFGAFSGGTGSNFSYGSQSYSQPNPQNASDQYGKQPTGQGGEYGQSYGGSRQYQRSSAELGNYGVGGPASGYGTDFGSLCRLGPAASERL